MTAPIEVTPEMAEETRIEAKAVIANAEALVRLQSNKDFKALFTEGYLKDEASRLVMLKADKESEIDPADIDQSITAISEFNMYMLNIKRAAIVAEGALTGLRIAQDEYDEFHKGDPIESTGYAV